MAELKTTERNHEKRDISVPAVAWFAAGLVVSAIVIHFGIAWLFNAYGRQYPSPEAPSRIAMQPRMIAPPPQLQTDPAADLKRFRANEEAELNHYGWIDRQKGIVRIPIEQAMELIVQRGLPTRKPGSVDASGLTPVDMQKQKAEATKP
jgi:hypothetical protein